MSPFFFRINPHLPKGQQLSKIGKITDPQTELTHELKEWEYVVFLPTDSEQACLKASNLLTESIEDLQEFHITDALNSGNRFVKRVGRMLIFSVKGGPRV